MIDNQLFQRKLKFAHLRYKMINDQNCHYYLRCLVKIADKRPLRYEEIPQEFINYFTLPGISQAINICINNRPEVDYDKVENYLKDKTFSSFDELASSIQTNFQSDYDKLYACFYFAAHHIEYDYVRKCTVNKKSLSIQTIFETRKGVCSDYSLFFRELAKMSGITSDKMLILPFENATKEDGWDLNCLPSDPNYDHEANYIKINNQIYLSEPTWGAGSLDNNHQFTFNYKKCHFLIPYYKGIIDHFPSQKFNESINGHFTFDHFKRFNQPNLHKELCFESNINQEITVDDGFYELQFSFIQPVETVYGKLFYLADNNWIEQEKQFISYECLAKNLPSIHFSYSNELRCRYKMIVSFPKAGKYKVTTYVNDDPQKETCPSLFTTFFNVKNSTDKIVGIPGSFKERYGFIPIVPKEGLTKITNGYARIRFTVKLSRSNLSVNMYEIKKGTAEDEKINLNATQNKLYNCFTTYLPFNYDSEDLNDRLVENWILIKFPNDGSYEFEIKFNYEDNLTTSYGVTYYFDVTGTQNDNVIYPYYDLSNNLTFTPFKIDCNDEVHLDPPEKTVIRENCDFYFDIFSEKEYIVVFTKFNTDINAYPHVISEKPTDNGNIIDRKYSAPNLDEGHYVLYIAYSNGSVFATQNYFILGSKLPKESPEEKMMMKDLKALLEGKYDHCKDIPSNIHDNVERMVADSIKAFNPNDADDLKTIVADNVSSELDSEEEKTKLKMKIIDLENRSNKLENENEKLNKQVIEMAKQKEEQEKRALSLEQEKNEISKKTKELMNQIENLNSKTIENDDEKIEMSTKLKELEQKKQELELKANNLEQENDNLNNKFNELSKQREENQKQELLLEQEKNRLNDKVNELEKQKEELIENMAKEKSIADSKIHELEEEIQKNEKYALSLEQEKNEINNKLKDMTQQKEDEKNKEEMITKLKELQNQIDLLEKEKNSMRSKINELSEQKEEQGNYSLSLELKNKEINQKLEQLLKQKEDINNKSLEQEKERNEMVSKLKELEQRKKEFEDKTNNLEHEKDDLNTKFNKLSKQKEELEERTKKLESEKNGLNNKVVELVKQKEEINKKMADEKSIADSKIRSYENQINELLNQIEDQKNHAKNLEQETKSLRKQVNELEKQKEEIISKEKTSKDQKHQNSEHQKDNNHIESKSNKTETKSNKIEKKSNQPEMESNQEKRKSNQPEIESNQEKRKSNQVDKKSNLPEIESNQVKRKSNQSEIDSNQEKGKSNLPKIESNQAKRKSNQSELDSNQVDKKSNLPKIESNQEKRKSNQSELESKQPELDLNIDKKSSNQTEIKSHQKEIDPNRPEIESNQLESKSNQEKRKSNQVDKKSNQQEIESNQAKRKSNQPEINSNIEKKSSNQKDNMNQNNNLQDQEENKHLPNKKVNGDHESTKNLVHDISNEPKIVEPKSTTERNSPRKKVRQSYDPSIASQPILPGTLPRRLHKCKRPIKLTITLKDIGMENFDQPYNGLPSLNNNKKITRSQDNINESRKEKAEELPSLFKHKKNAQTDLQTQDQTTQTQTTQAQKSPRRKKERSYNYDPSIFRTPLCPDSPVGPVRYFKDPVGLTVTLKDIGMDEFES